jgi:putative DNA primase/helicase
MYTNGNQAPIDRQDTINQAIDRFDSLNERLSTKAELRFGTNGSKAVKLDDGAWFDHETGEGGYLRREKANDNPSATPVIAATYDYHDATGKLLFQVVRKMPKTFVQRRPDGAGGWLWNMQGIEGIPYQLPALLKADPSATVYINEGEKGTDAVRDLLLTATNSPGGAGKWQPSMSAYLQDRHVVIIADNDEAGEAHAADVATKLTGLAGSVKILRLPDLPPKGDAFDWIAAGGTAEELEQLAAEAIAQAAKQWGVYGPWPGSQPDQENNSPSVIPPPASHSGGTTPRRKRDTT